MSQAEIAGGQMTPPNDLPTKGQQLRDVGLPSAIGAYIQLSEYRGRRNLVLVFADERRATAELLSAMAAQEEVFKAEEAQIVVITQLPREESAGMRDRLQLPFPVLSDKEGQIHRAFGTTDSQGHATAAVYVTDRYAVVFGVYRTRDGQALPTVAETLKWLEFINSQCPECEPPEWPT